MTSKDTIYASPLANVAGFRFDDSVAAVFPDMISRSVPGYSNIIDMTGLLAARYAVDGSRCYDLGCSLGASTLAMVQALPDREIRFVAVDNSPAMLERAQTHFADLAPPPAIDWQCGNLQDVAIADASVVVMNFTLQFVPLAERDAVISNIYQGLRPGGILVLSEKIRFDNAVMQDLTTDLHHAFKRAHGYSELEVSQKRTALENVLVPETVAEHEARLRQAGFSDFGLWFQCFNFVSLVAIK